MVDEKKISREEFQSRERPVVREINPAVLRLGYYSAMIACIAAAGYGAAQLLQVAGALTFPVDAFLIYGFSICISVPYVTAVIAVHHTTSTERNIWSHIAIAFAIMYATYVNLNYVVQLATVVPRSLTGTLDEVKVLDQTPHSLFWDVDGLGYICMGISTFFLAFAFPAGESRQWLRRFLIANGLVVPLISTVYFYPRFSIALLLMGSPWIITTCGSLLLLAISFRKELMNGVKVVRGRKLTTGD